jgi:hypothetical protein
MMVALALAPVFFLHPVSSFELVGESLLAAAISLDPAGRL